VVVHTKVENRTPDTNPGDHQGNLVGAIPVDSSEKSSKGLGLPCSNMLVGWYNQTPAVVRIQPKANLW